jgi:hypothetical protein
MATVLRSRLGRLALAASLFLLPTSASATALGAVLTTTGVNTLSIFLRIQCSGLLCFAIGGSTPYAGQTQTSTLSGTVGLWVDDTADTLQFSSDAGGTADLLNLTGTNITFTGLNTTLTGGPSNVTVSNLVTTSINAGLASVLGLDLNTPPQSIPFSMTGANALQLTAGGVTNAPNLPVIALGGTPVDSQGTLVFTDPDTDLMPDFLIQNLRGAFQTLTSTATLGVTLAITLRATFTLNFIGESLMAVPEPASFALVALGVGSFALAARRRGLSASEE